jgi:uncharacterized protein
MYRSVFLALTCLALASVAGAQDLPLPEEAVGDPVELSKAMPALARQVLAGYKEGDRDKYLDSLFRLQIVAGQYEKALATTAALRERLRDKHAARATWVNVQYEIFARAKVKEESANLPFKDAYVQSFREVFSRLDDRTSSLVIRGLTLIDPSDMQQDLQSELQKQKGKSAIPLADALKLVRYYLVAEAYRTFAVLNPTLVAEDDHRRYLAENDIMVKTPDGATVCAFVVRPRTASQRLPALLNFTIYVDPNDNLNNARMTAANGYAGVEGFTRGKACSSDKPVPYEHDGPDAAALIDWISAQPWSDGRVGMYGGSYEGFTQWATAKHMPKALKALMTGAPAAPAIDVPMEGNVIWNFIYPWPFYTTNAKGADNATYADNKRWRRLNHDWYVSGRAYHDLDKIDGTPNPIFDQWISHPDYDAFWQNVIPYKEEFARIHIPVLVTAGYYYGGPGAAVYYFGQYSAYDPTAEHYLLIGPYDHLGAQFGVVGLVGNLFDNLRGLELDPVSIIDLTEMRYQWFDYIFKGGPRPSLLEDKVNYEVTGANVWKHAPTLAEMASQTLRFHLSAVPSGTGYRLSEQKPSGDNFVPLKVDFADRSDVDRRGSGGGVLDNAVDTWNGIEFVSDPLETTIQLSGLFSGHLDFISNKKDFDFEIDLYEQTPEGEYVQLTSYWTRASYIGDHSHRKLLTPDKRQRLDFESVRLMSRQLRHGSRVVAVLSVIKEPGRQINYGTGKDVSDETIADAKEPLQIEWFDGTYIILPVGK